MVRKGSRVQVPTTAPRFLGRYQSGQLGQTVNLLAYVFVGSNPTRPTRIRASGLVCFYMNKFTLISDSEGRQNKVD